MSEEQIEQDPQQGDTEERHSTYKPGAESGSGGVHHLTGMYRNWFLDYASYVILERAVPHLGDGLKPVQRRILHTMKRMDDGRYNKVANIVGETMKFHPHGDASIGDALVQLGQKDLLIDTQGNWGNILTGDSAAAARYIEARLSKLALDIVFNPKTTEWKLSYDGRNKEPIALPVKFPLLLAQGAEGIAVGLTSKILPHNLGELCDASIACLKGEDFHLYPDFPTGGFIDVARYNDGQRGGTLKIRARIEKLDAKTLVIREIPFSKTTSSLIDSILRANEKGKIKIRKVDDNTAADVEILVHLTPGVSPDKTIDALYAFTDCEISLSPNCCVIDDHTPRFLSVGDILRLSSQHTMELLRQELLIRRGELMESLHFASLEKIFIEERIYKDKPFEQAPDMETAFAHIMQRLTPYLPTFFREVTREDLSRLMEIRMARILKFNKDKADELILRMKGEVERIDRDLQNMTQVAVNWFALLKEKYAAHYPRRTEIRSFDNIEAAKVVEANQKLYINRAEGFIGTGLKKYELVDSCSDIDDVILFYKDGTFKVTRIADKVFVGETEKSRREKRKAKVIHLAVFKKGDKRTIYNVIYRDGKAGNYYSKRFCVTGVTHDREYDLTQGTDGSRVEYFSCNPNGEAEVVKVLLEKNPRVKKEEFEYDFSALLIKGRQSMGNLLTKNVVKDIRFKSQGGSTLGGRKVWFDGDVQRINYDEHGRYLGEFSSGDRILVTLPDGTFYTTDFSSSNHYEPALSVIEKYDENKVWTAILRDAAQGNMLYVKRFRMERASKPLNFLGENPDNKLVWMSDKTRPAVRLTFGGGDSFRKEQEIILSEFIGVKSHKAKGKRLTTFEVEHMEDISSDMPETVGQGEEPKEAAPSFQEDGAASQMELFES